MLDSGENPLFVLRRLVRFASEDVGLADPKALGLAIDAKDAYHLQVVLNLDVNSTITLSNAQGERFALDVSAASRMLTVHRNASTGVTDFSDMFSIPSMNAPLNTDGSQVTIDFFVDQSSVEIFAGDSRTSITNLVFPQSIYNHLTVVGAKCEAKVRALHNVWK